MSNRMVAAREIIRMRIKYPSEQICGPPVAMLIVLANHFAGQTLAGNIIYRKYNVKHLSI
jgi:hypothetical protein